MAAGVTPRPGSDGKPINVEIGPYSIAAATTFGPRLVSLRFLHGPELFAQLSDEVVIVHPDSGTYHFRGGHRLWAAPEVPAITYASDDQPCEVFTRDEGLTIKAPIDPAGLFKEIRVSLDDDKLLVDHHLGNGGPGPIPVAPWGITQFRLGGAALIPIGTGVVDDPLQADSSLVLWPYTDLTDRRLSWRSQAAIIEATPGPRFKVGSGPSPGKVGYFFEDQLFTKEIAPAGPGSYVDRGAVAQMFVEDSFCELESLGPLVSLDPSAKLSHREVWKVEQCPDLAAAYDRVVLRSGR
jgi:hypothetical protein